MDMVAVYLDVDFTVSLKNIVAFLQPLQLAFDAVREFVIYVPRGREVVLRVRVSNQNQESDVLICFLPLSGAIGPAQDVLCCL